MVVHCDPLITNFTVAEGCYLVLLSAFLVVMVNTRSLFVFYDLSLVCSDALIVKSDLVVVFDFTFFTRPFGC